MYTSLKIMGLYMNLCRITNAALVFFSDDPHPVNFENMNVNGFLQYWQPQAI